jgi:hypothetical protein
MRKKGGLIKRRDHPINNDDARCFREVCAMMEGSSRLLMNMYNRNAHLLMIAFVDGHPVPIVQHSSTFRTDPMAFVQFNGKIFSLY